jgi:hypothetical protein
VATLKRSRRGQPLARVALPWITAAGLALGGTLTGCARGEDPEAAVRAVIAAGEAAAEARDVGAALDLVSADYGDDRGQDRAALGQFVRGWFALNPRVELVIRIDSLEFPEPNRARVELAVTSLASRGRLAIEGERLSVELVDEDGAWRLLRVARARD